MVEFVVLESTFAHRSSGDNSTKGGEAPYHKKHSESGASEKLEDALASTMTGLLNMIASADIGVWYY